MNYRKIMNIPILWCNLLPNVTFTIVIENFVVKYRGYQYSCQLLDELEKYYTIEVYCTSGLCFGMKIIWYYAHHNIDMYISKYFKIQ